MTELIKKGFKTEDWLAVWLGFFIIVLVLIGVRPQMPTFKWATEGEFSSTVAESKSGVEKLLEDAKVRGDVKLHAAALALKSASDAGDRSGIQSTAKKLGDIAKWGGPASHRLYRGPGI